MALGYRTPYAQAAAWRSGWHTNQGTIATAQQCQAEVTSSPVFNLSDFEQRERQGQQEIDQNSLCTNVKHLFFLICGADQPFQQKGRCVTSRPASHRFLFLMARFQ